MGIVVGCDVSKNWIDVHCAGNSPQRLRLDNKIQAINRFARALPAGSQVGMEATGEMHLMLARRLVKLGHIVFVINPRWIHAYAKAIGMRGKTDRTDAALIARFVVSEGPNMRPYKPPGVDQEALRKLLLRRCTVVKLKTATHQSLGDEGRELVAQFNRVLRQLERQIVTILKRVPDWQALGLRLQTEPGVGPIVAAHLVEVLTRFPFASADAFIAHTGLDPRPNDSGQKQGRRRLTHHGDASLRTMLYLAAMSASKRPEWRAIYESNRAKGLSTTAALVVVARKIARVAFGIFKSGKSYDPSRIGCSGSA